MSEITIVIGTYTGGLIGLKGPLTCPSTIFAFSATTNCIKSLQVQDKVLIVGGYDETLRLFNLDSKQEMGGMLENAGSINFVSSCRSHVLTGSEQGNISVWRCKDWNNLHSFKGHRKAITGLALHPSEKMALSVGKDRKLYLWNLVKARPAFKCRMNQVLEDIQWSPCGFFFIARTDREVRLFNVECSLKQEFVEFYHERPLVSIGFLGRSDSLFWADLFGEIVLQRLGHGSISFQAHTARLTKALFTEIDNRKILVTITTLGEIIIWNITAAVKSLSEVHKKSHLKIENFEEMMIFKTNLNCRCSSLVVSSE